MKQDQHSVQLSSWSHLELGQFVYWPHKAQMVFLVAVSLLLGACLWVLHWRPLQTATESWRAEAATLQSQMRSSQNHPTKPIQTAPWEASVSATGLRWMAWSSNHTPELRTWTATLRGTPQQLMHWLQTMCQTGKNLGITQWQVRQDTTWHIQVSMQQPLPPRAIARPCDPLQKISSTGKQNPMVATASPPPSPFTLRWLATVQAGDAHTPSQVLEVDDQVHVLQLGQSLPNGWQLKKVENDRLVLRNAQGKEKVLHVQESPELSP